MCISLNCPEILTFSPILVSTNSSVISKSLLHNSFFSTTGDVNCIDEFLLVLQYFVAMKIQRRKSVNRLLFATSKQNVCYLLKIKFFTSYYFIENQFSSELFCLHRKNTANIWSDFPCMESAYICVSRSIVKRKFLAIQTFRTNGTFVRFIHFKELKVDPFI